MGKIDYLPQNQKIFIILTGFILLFIVVELVRRRKILEQYSAIWLFISLCAVSFVWIYPFVNWVTKLIGAGGTTSTILFGGFFALLLLSMQLSVKISEFAFHIKDIIQELTLLSERVRSLNERLERLEKPEQSTAESDSVSTENKSRGKGKKGIHSNG